MERVGPRINHPASGWNHAACVALSALDVDATFAGTTAIPTEVSATIAQFGAGVTAKLSARGSLFANLAYSMNVGGGHRSAIGGGAGMRWKW